MSAEQALLNAYSEWHRLAEAEGSAIRMRNWNFLLECQRTLKKFQPLITQLTFAARNEWKNSGADYFEKEKAVHTVVSELIELGQRNQTLLKAAREAAQAKREHLAAAVRNLKRLQLSYVSARTSAWTSFS
ncbi:MAG TPA: hypothetical protein VHY30_11185 [Verrucomicrobiae bacterium]|jgi:hypothetical protein|nr:hypothetical protein [Verrucomicrobiae bacterium]